jgi:Ca-activated chloride channel family protein
VIRAIGGLGPKGKTPLGDAVRQAAAALQYTEDPATVVLISDGKENCGMDPCALGTELARTGVDFTALVIGFDVDEIDQAGLRCLAENTGGLFLPAEDATGLREAIDRTVEEVEAPPAPVVEDPGEATLSAPVEVRAGSEFEVSWTGPDSRNDYITLVPRGSDDREYGTYVYTRRGSPIIISRARRGGAA